MAKKICGECGAPRGTPHKDECSGAAYRGVKAAQAAAAQATSAPAGNGEPLRDV